MSGWVPERGQIGGMRRPRGPWSHDRDFDPDVLSRGGKLKRRKRRSRVEQRFVTYPEDVEISRNGRKIQ